MTYTLQTANFNTSVITAGSSGYAGTYNNSATELAQYANGGGYPGAAIFETFTTTGNGNTGAVRALQVGDTFTLTGYVGANPSAGGYLGISFRDSTTYSNVVAATDNTTEARFQLDNTGGWKVYNGGTAVDSNLGSAADRTFTIKITSANSFNATVGGTTYYNLSMGAGGGSIDSFAIYNVGDSNSNTYWKNASLSNTGTVELGYAAAGGTTVTPGLVADGLSADSASTVSVNSVVVGGDAGSSVILDQANTYTGATAVNANAALEARNANALGTTAAGTSVTSGGALKLYNATGISYASEALTLNGTGVSGVDGALRSTGGNNTWNGAITLGSGTRINADTSGAAGSLTIAGSITGGSNVLFVGATGAGTKTGGDITISGIISGAGATQDATVTSLYKDGAGTLTLSGANTYTGDTRVVVGNLTVATGGSLGIGSDIYLATNTLLTVNTSTAVASVQEVGTGNAGTIALGSGATLTVNGTDKGTLYQNSISGAGALTMNGSGTTSLSLYGTQAYTGATTVSGGKISTGVALASSGVSVSGGTFETSAADLLANSATVAVSGSGTYSLGGNDTVASLSITGGALSTTNSSILTASTYALNGGTVNANLGTGTVTASSGTTLLNGTSGATTVNVTGGLLSLASANRLADTAAVAVSSGELAVGGSDTVGSLAMTGGLLSTANGSTLTAATYALNGGTVTANLGTGTVTASSGSATLSGTSAATTVNVTGGLLALSAANRLSDSAAVSVSSGTLSMGANSDTVGSLITTGGTVSGSGTMTAATYALQGGTVSANLGAGALTSSSGTTSLSGTSAATAVNVTGGTLNTSAANKLLDTAAVVVSSGTLGLGGSDTVGSLAASGTGTVTVASGSTLTANGNSSIEGSAKATGGTVAIANNSKLTLANSSTTTTSDLSIGSGSTLAGTGGTSGQIKGGGLLSPGNSPGIITAGSVNLSGGIDFAFEFTATGAPTYSSATNSKNDLLHLTSGVTPFSGSFTAANTVSIYFNDANLNATLLSVTPSTYLGGFFVDATSFDIAGLLSSASLQYFIAAVGGTTTFNGVNYNLMSTEVTSRMLLSNQNQSSAAFTTGSVSGTVLGVTTVPEPSSTALLALGLAAVSLLRRRRRIA